jgi:hypothetical protein
MSEVCAAYRVGASGAFLLRPITGDRAKVTPTYSRALHRNAKKGVPPPQTEPPLRDIDPRRERARRRHIRRGFASALHNDSSIIH